jgi:transmembrane sensor
VASETSEPSDDTLFVEASGWFARLHADDVTDAERRQFEHWHQQSGAHAQAWREVQKLFDTLHAPAIAVHERLKQQRQYPFESPRAPTAVSRPPPKVWRKRLSYWAATAAFVWCMASAVLWGTSILQNLASDYHTGKGEQRQVALGDGSQIVLNTDTAIAVDISDHQRRITILRGEAYFELQAAPERPVIVISQQGEARVIGTAFNMAQRGERTIVTVAEGVIEISHAADPATPVLVHAGHQVSYDTHGVAAVQPADLTAVTAWRRGQIVFWQQPLTKVIDEVNRYRPGRLVIINPSIRHRSVTGAFDIHRLNDVLDVLQHSLGIKATTLTGYLVLLH